MLCTLTLHCRLASSKSPAKLLQKRWVLNLQYQRMAVIWNQASCVWRFSKIHPGSLKAAFPGCYVFCGFGLAHCRQGIVGTVIRLRKRRNRRPKCPSYTHSDRLSWGIQEHDTISSRCTQWEGACYRGLCNCQDLLVWSCRQITGCSLCKVKRKYELRIVSRRLAILSLLKTEIRLTVWYLCGKFRFCACAQ